MPIRILALLVTGVVIGVTLGAVMIDALPIWLGVSVITAVGHVTYVA